MYGMTHALDVESFVPEKLFYEERNATELALFGTECCEKTISVMLLTCLPKYYENLKSYINIYI